MKKVSYIICCFAILPSLLMSACSSGGATSSAGSTKQTPGAKKVTLRYNWWGSQVRHDMTLKAIKIFEEKNPGITIEPEFGNYDGYFDKLNVQMSAGSAPDLFTVDLFSVNTYISNGAALSYQPYIDKGKLNVNDIDKLMLKYGSANEKQYGFPTGSLASGILCDVDIFKELGIDLPSNDWTWEDFYNTCVKIHEKSGGKYYGSSDCNGDMNFAEMWVRQYGIPEFTDGHLTAGVEKYYAGWFKMWDDLRKGKGVPPAEVTANEGYQMENRGLSLGTAAMDINSTNKVATYEGVMKNRGHKIALIAFPHQKNEKRAGGFVQPSQFICVSSKSKNPDEAVKFIDYIANDLDSAKALGYERGVQVNAKFRKEMIPFLNATDLRMNDFIDYASKNYSSMDGLTPQGYVEARAKFLTVSQTIAFGTTSIEDACRTFAADANKIFDRAK